MSDFVLYNYFRSSTSYRARIALNLKGIRYEYSPIHLLNGDQHSVEYKAKNPSGEVPTLVHKNRAIAQSMAIVEYLDAIQPSPRLFPADAYLAAKVRQFCETINSGMHAYQNLKTLKYLETEFNASPGQRIVWTNHWLQKGFQSLEEQLHGVAGTYCFGDNITAADAFLVPQVFVAKRFNVDIAKFPLCRGIAERCEAHVAFAKAHPYRQIDTPADLKMK